MNKNIDLTMLKIAIRNLFLPNKNLSFVNFVLFATISAISISLTLVIAILFIASGLGTNLINNLIVQPPSIADSFGMIIFAPLVETLILIFFIKLLQKVLEHHMYIKIVSALIWATLHGLYIPMAFVGTLWSFFIFSHAYLEWKPVSTKHAFWAACLPHFFLNSIVISSYFIDI